MNNLWLKIKIWTKVGVLALVAIYLLVFLIQNLSNEATFWWWFGHETTHSVLVLILLSFVVGALATLFARTAVRTFNQVRQMTNRTRTEQLHRDVADMKQKASMLNTREPASPPTPAMPPPQNFPPPPPR
jgi:uncharacterized integral membrane protein